MSVKNNIKISVIIPTYNSQNTIEKAIDSALNQNFSLKNFEIIVINDASTDKTLEILRVYGKKIKIVNNLKNQGAVKTSNKGFKMAKGKYVIKLDADDCFRPNILKEMSKILDKNPKIDFIYSDYYEKPVSGKIKIISIRKNIFNTVAGGIMFRKHKFEKEGFYNENLILPEYDLWLKTQNKWKGYHINKPLFYYIRRKESITGNKNLIKKAINQLKQLYPDKIKEINKIRSY